MLDIFLKESNAIEGVYDEDSFNQAKLAWNYLVEQKELSASVIMKTHKILMLNQKLLPNEKGYFRTVSVCVGNRICMNPASVSYGIDEWCGTIKKVITGYYQGTSSAKELIQQDHIRFEKIHPFIDGNGRVGRMLMNWERLKCGLPLLVIKEKEKKEYYEWFK